MSAFGLVLVVLVGAAMVLTGLPAFAILIAGALIGAVAAWATGTVPLAIFNILPGRLLALLEHDLLQALPLFVFMGVLLERMGVAPALFQVLVAGLGRGRRAPLIAGMGLGALLGPMNGSVSASVLGLSRSIGPPLAAAGIAPGTRLAVIAVAGTLGVVIPPSLVLILLGDAMMTAHTIAVNATGRADRIINTQDVFRGAFVPAALFLGACLCLAAYTGGRRPRDAADTSPVEEVEPPVPGHGWRVYAVALSALVGLVGLLTAVALGYLYAVEAAATGAFVLLVIGVATGKLGRATFGALLTEAMQSTGALFAPLLAATSFTLVLRTLGTDKLVAAFVNGLPGSPLVAVAVVLAVIAVSALVLDAFEIIFVVVPIVIPALLMRVPDAVWVSTLVLLTLQASFLLPPAGYALLMARNATGITAPMREVVRALVPFLLAQLAVVGLVLSEPRLVHLTAPKPAVVVEPAAPSAEEAARRLRQQLPPLPAFGLPTFGGAAGKGG